MLLLEDTLPHAAIHVTGSIMLYGSVHTSSAAECFPPEVIRREVLAPHLHDVYHTDKLVDVIRKHFTDDVICVRHDTR